MKRPDSATGTGELEEERDFLLRSLDDLDRERAAGDLDPADYVALKEDYTARAAAVLRAIDHGAGRGAPSEPATPARDHTEPATPARDHTEPATPARDHTEPAAPARDHTEPATPARDDTEPATPARAATGAQPDWARYGTPLPARRARAGTRTVPRKTAPRAAPTASRRLRPWLVGAGVLVFAALAGALVALGAGERGPGQSAAGSITATGPSAQVARARQLMGQGRFLDALKAYDAALAKDPGQPEALTYRGWLIRLTGKADNNTALIDRGLASIEKAIAADADYPDAHLFRGIILFEDKGNAAAAVPELELYLARSPSSPTAPSVRDVLARARAASAAGPTTATTAPAG